MGCFVKQFYNFLIYIFLIFSFDKNIIINANQKKINKLEINNLFNYNSKMSTQNKYNKMNKKIDKSELIDNKILEVGKPLFVDHLIYPILGILESFLYAKFLEPDMKILSKKQLLEKENNVSPFVLNWRKQYKENFM